MSFEKEYSQKKAHFEQTLSDFVASLKDIPQPLLSSIVYSLQSGGKRLRPILLSSCAEEQKTKNGDGLDKLALAVECVHTYSLIHDDLPCMDNADMRRGKPSNHKIYGECTAVLAGDSLLNLTYELLFEAIVTCSFDERERYIRAGKLIADCCGATGLIGGQTVDTVVDDTKHIATRLNYVYQHKTADLIAASMTAGAIAAGASETDIELIKSVGDNMGYAFQIVDDLIDLDSGEDAGKQTFVNVYGEKEGRKAVADKTTFALDTLAKLNGDFSFLRSMIKNLSLRKE